MPRCKLIVDDWGNISGRNAEFESYDELEAIIEEACQLNNWPRPAFIEDPAGNEPGVYVRSASSLRRIAEPI